MGVKLIIKEKEQKLLSFNELEAGRLAVIVDADVGLDRFIGQIVVRVIGEPIVQMIGVNDFWAINKGSIDAYKCRYLEVGECLEITE